jgi:hypothetical protein
VGSGRERIDHGAALRALLAPALARCPGSARVDLVVEATFDEVVDVEAAGPDPARTACALEAAWGLRLDRRFNRSQLRYVVAIESTQVTARRRRRREPDRDDDGSRAVWEAGFGTTEAGERLASWRRPRAPRASVSGLGPRGLGGLADAEAAHLLRAAHVRMGLGLAFGAGARLHEHDLRAALVATEPFSDRMGHAGLLSAHRW